MFPSADLQFSDVDYALPDSTWLTGKFYEFYKAWRTDYGFDTWSNRLDCDNFSCMFFCFAQLCHAKSDRPEQAIAVGEFFYGKDGDKINKGHAINIALTEKGLIHIEPQTGQILKLSQAEKDSAWFIRY